MKRSHRNRLVPALLSLVSVGSLLLYAPASDAQQASQSSVPTRYVLLDYMKVPPGKEAEYVRLEREVWKPVHQERIKNKRMVAWELYAVRYTADTQRQYDYVTVNVYESLAATDDDTGLEAMFRRVHAGKDASRLLTQTGEARQVARAEVWRLLDQTAPGTASAAPSKYLLVDYMRAKPGVNYVAVEQQLWKPIHQERVRRGALDRWSLFELVLPGGTSYPYDYGTVNALSSLSALADPYPADLFQHVHPNTSLTDLGNRTGAARDLTRSELWVLVDATR
jgi:L-rhamnose mutarotase